MKQHITPTQFKEMNKERAIELFDLNARDWRGYEDDFYNYHHKKITIGRMIDFLSIESIIFCPQIDGWKIGTAYGRRFLFAHSDLCDALWKSVLEYIK